MMLNEKQILAAFMKEHSETVKSVADKSGMNNRTLSNQLGRPESTLTLSTVYALMKAMGVEIVFRDEHGTEHVLSEDCSQIAVEENKLANEKVSAIKAEMKPPERR